MLSKVKKCVLFAMLVVASLSSASTAGAAVATITGGPSVTGTATTATILKLHNAGKTLSCTGSTSSGSVVSSATGLLPMRIGTVTAGFTGCNIVGGLGISVSCQPSALNVTALTAGGRTPGSITGINCHVYITTQTACRISIVGATGATYINATTGSGAQRTTDTSHQSLAATNSTNGAGGACAILPNDTSARFVNTSNGDLQYTVSPTNLSITVSPSGFTPSWSHTPSTMHFPSVGTQTGVTFTNNTGATKTITSITKPCDFSVVSMTPSLPATVAAGGTLTVQVRLDAGTASGSLSIVSASGTEDAVALAP
jgi:hypothetical protein